MKLWLGKGNRHYVAALSALLAAALLVLGVTGCGMTQYELTFSSTEGGSVTAPGEGTYYFDFGAEVSLVATPDSGYRFVSWAGGGAPIDDVTSPSTTITSVQGNYNVKASFELTGPIQYTLSISSTAGGSVTAPGEGQFTSEEGTVVNLVASAATGYRFVEWQGDVSEVSDPNTASTSITMNGNYSVIAKFELIPPDQYNLTISSTSGGSVTTPGEGTYYHDPEEEVDLVATADTGYEFSGWSGDVGTVANANAASTTITMNGNYTITANFQAEGDGVNFPDPNLEAAIRAAIAKPTGPIEPSDLQGLIFLDASEQNITNLTGLQYCTDLKYLFLVDNQISDISPLATLASLQRLFLGSNQISSISSLTNLTNLTELGLWENQISNISPLANLTNLSVLYLADNQISNLSPLTNLTNLSVLYLWSNQISDIGPLVDNTGLGTDDYVDLRWNPLSSTSIGTHIPALQGRGVTVVW
ncbi:MAG: InlB B-repeat-containing protein [Dehalococcoidia bacterium]